MIPTIISDRHVWTWDEGSAGVPYEFCRRCFAYRDDVEPNQHHGYVPCG